MQCSQLKVNTHNYNFTKLSGDSYKQVNDSRLVSVKSIDFDNKIFKSPTGVRCLLRGELKSCPDSRAERCKWICTCTVRCGCGEVWVADGVGGSEYKRLYALVIRFAPPVVCTAKRLAMHTKNSIKINMQSVVECTFSGWITIDGCQVVWSIGRSQSYNNSLLKNVETEDYGKERLQYSENCIPPVLLIVKKKCFNQRDMLV